jgi:ABC-2 type transport system permease protein
LPTVVYIVAVYQLGMPKGNLDLGGIIGSYIGLLLLGGVFVAIGVFSSSITNNQIIAFIVSVLICAFSYIGFDAIATNTPPSKSKPMYEPIIPPKSKLPFGIPN